MKPIKRIIIRTLLLCTAFICIFLNGIHARENRVLDSLLQVLKQHPADDSAKTVLYRRIFREYLYQNETAKANQYLYAALNLAEKLPQKTLLANLCERIGITYHGKGDYLNALHYYDRVIDLGTRIGDQDLIAGIYLNKTDIYQNVSDYASAIDAAEHSLKLYAALKNEGGMAACYNNLSLTYIALKDFRNAHYYATKALPVFEKEGAVSRGVASIKELLGSILLQATEADLRSFGIASGERYEKAIQYFRQAVSIATLLKDNDLKGTLLIDLGTAYEKDKRIAEAIESVEGAVPVILQGLEQPVLATNLISAGALFIRNNRTKQGLRYLYHGLAQAKRSGLLKPQQTAYETLSKFYEQHRQFDSALLYHQQYAALKDSIFNQDKDKEITRKKMALDFSIREQEYRFQQEMSNKQLQEQLLRSKVQQAEINLKNRVGLLLSLLALIVLIAAFFIYKSRQKAIAMNKTIEAQRKSLEQLVLVKDQVFSVIGHDLRSPINALMSFVQILEHMDITKDQLAKYAESLGNQLRFTSSLMENLLHWAGSQMQGFNPHFEQVNLNNTMDAVLQSLYAAAQQKRIQILYDFEKASPVWADREMLTLVLRNLLSNAIKFSYPDSTIQVTYTQTGSEQEICITDTGTGLTAEQLESINGVQVQAVESRYGTQMEKGTGLGLMLSKSFLELMQGRIVAANNATGGSSFRVILPFRTA
ncbi:MAG: tetratricopeptide repeat-containing sensor histidine kinase [Sediminibacterium sp.]|nr:tetratricopeptide repeat-containing sensor histidine kinase [Sediminibacterium sp.]